MCGALSHQTTVPSSEVTPLDVAIVGGGIAGLWLLARLRAEGYAAALFETESLGAGQTRCAQGIIHGGTKYALTGKLTASTESIHGMPALWRACLEGRGEIDLRGVRIASEHQYLWSTESLASRLAGFFAGKAMSSRMQRLEREVWPALFQHAAFHGTVYRLEEPVLDMASLLERFAALISGVAFKAEDLRLNADASPGLQVSAGDGAWRDVSARLVVLAAGAGNAELLQYAGLAEPQMQRRPLHMLLLRGDLPEIHAHCLGPSANPRLTVTSHRDRAGRLVWYLGGEVAETGVGLAEAEQIDRGRQELGELLPWLDLRSVEWSAFHVDRAEPRRPGGRRPDDFFVQQTRQLLVTWPTKLALAPRLAQAVLDKLRNDDISPSGGVDLRAASFQAPAVAPMPWDEAGRKWS